MTKHSLNNITQNANIRVLHWIARGQHSNDKLNGFGKFVQRSSVVKATIILHLDEFNDPRNFGSVLRTAAFFGVDMITFAKKNSCPISPTVSVVAAGAVDELSAQNKLQAVNMNTPDFLHAASSDCGYNIFGTLLNPNAIDATQMELSKPTILVFE